VRPDRHHSAQHAEEEAPEAGPEQDAAIGEEDDARLVGQKQQQDEGVDPAPVRDRYGDPASRRAARGVPRQVLGALQLQAQAEDAPSDDAADPDGDPKDDSRTRAEFSPMRPVGRAGATRAGYAGRAAA
jgi:hypothetical protein